MVEEGRNEMRKSSLRMRRLSKKEDWCIRSSRHAETCLGFSWVIMRTSVERWRLFVDGFA
jgi:hypothetical protein